MNFENILKDKFGLESFRDGQLDIIKSVIEKNDTLVFMPTGGGKSLIYQFSGVCLEGLVVVISPLISLMKDQVDKLNALGLRAELVNSTINSTHKRLILDEISTGNHDEKNAIKFLYIAPERLNDEEFLQTIKSTKIALIAIDEAHCISQWGHDFRPSYLKIKDFIGGLRSSSPELNPPIPNPFPRGKGDLKELSSFYEKTPDYITKLSQDLRKNQTSAEEFMWEILRNHNFCGLKFRRQHPFGRYIADFYSDEAKIVIELDGKIHDFQKEYDEIRDNIISKYGIKILRFSNEDIFNNLNFVLNKIYENVSSNIPFSLGGKGQDRGIFGDKSIKGGYFPIVALTATATKKVRADIVERLGISESKVFTKGFDRKNLIYIVREITKEQEKLQKTLEIIQKTPPFGIVYCSSVKNVSKVYQYLLENGIRVGIYNGEMQANLREQQQNNFMDSTYDVMVATNAFGMGIDKKDIRYVIHYNLPGSIENYYQEAGRAGRDGKTSYSVIIASYQDTIIQEFFIENSHPPKETILRLYDYLYHDFKIGDGVNHQILQTYASIASAIGVQSSMQVGTIVKLFEKYGIVKRGFDGDGGDDFRGKGITLVLPKLSHSDLPILWAHQLSLKDESYFKLEQIKKLLFKPGCRKRFILEYFGDEEDLAMLTDNCGVCDYCIDKKAFANSPDKQMIPYTVFLILLEFVKRLDEKFGVNVLVGILVGSKEKKLIDWNLDLDKDYGILSIYSMDFVKAMIESLYENGFLYKSMGEYPKIGISHKGIDSIFNNKVLIAEDENLQTSIMMKTRNSPKYALEKMEKKHTTRKIKVEKVDKVDTYTQTLNLLETGITLDEIAKNREVTLQTIESHLVKLYEYDKISLSKIMQYSSLEILKEVKETIKSKNLPVDKLGEIKQNMSSKISYFDIKIALAMMGKGDL